MTASHKPRSTKPSPAKARRERETLERREAILAAARDVFFENGIHRAHGAVEPWSETEEVRAALKDI